MKFNKINGNTSESECGQYYISKASDGTWVAYRNGKEHYSSTKKNAVRACELHEGGDPHLFND